MHDKNIVGNVPSKKILVLEEWRFVGACRTTKASAVVIWRAAAKRAIAAMRPRLELWIFLIELRCRRRSRWFRAARSSSCWEAVVVMIVVVVGSSSSR